MYKILLSLIVLCFTFGISHALVVAPIFAIALIKLLAIVFGSFSVVTAVFFRFLKKVGTLKTIIYAAMSTSFLIFIASSIYLVVGLISEISYAQNLDHFSLLVVVITLITIIPISLVMHYSGKSYTFRYILLQSFGIASTLAVIFSTVLKWGTIITIY
jgi:hypothetical protein